MALAELTKFLGRDKREAAEGVRQKAIQLHSFAGEQLQQGKRVQETGVNVREGA